MSLSSTSGMPWEGELPSTAGRSMLSRGERIFMRFGMVLASVLAAAGLLATEGEIHAIVDLAILFILCFVTAWNFRWGVNAFILLVLACDQHQIPDVDSFTFDLNYFNNINAIPYLREFEWAGVTPMEVHLALLIIIWVILVLQRRHPRPQGVAMWFTLVALVIWLVVSLMRGLDAGGDIVICMWELRGLTYLAIMYAFVPQVIQTREHLHTLLWIVIAGIAFKACEGTGRFLMSGLSLAGRDTLLNHADPIFITTLLVFLAALLLFNAQTRQKTALLLLALPLMLGFYAGNRRAAFASLAASALAFIVAVPRRELAKFWLIAIPFLLMLAAYTALYWNSGSKLATPLRQLKSGFASDKELSERNFYSNLYRKIEDYDLAVTAQNAPVAGIGFGLKFEQPIPLQKITYALRDYMAHNNILWFFVKTGAVGFFLFWFFFNTHACRMMGLLANMHDPYLKAVSLTIIVAVINQLAAAYFDLHLTAYRTMLFLGVLMGLLPVLSREAQRETPAMALKGT